MTSQGMDERGDNEDDNTDKPPVGVAICEFQNTAIKKKKLSTMAVLDLGTMIIIKKCMPGLDNSDDDASAVTVPTKNLSEGKYNEPMDILQGMFDTDTTQAVELPKEQKKYRERKTNRHQKKNLGKHAMNSTEGAGGTKHDHERNQQEDQSNSSRNGGSCGNNSKDQRNEDTNKLSQFNDKRYPGNLGGDGDTADVEQLQTFCINIKSQGVLKGKVAKVLKAFSFECMNKVDGLTFNPMKNQTLPTPTPISTKEAFPTASARFLEFFNTIMTQRGVTVYYRIKSTITVMDLWHRVFYFLQENHA